MRYRTLGRTGVQVSSLVLGAHEGFDTSPALLDSSLRRR